MKIDGSVAAVVTFGVAALVAGYMAWRKWREAKQERFKRVQAEVARETSNATMDELVDINISLGRHTDGIEGSVRRPGDGEGADDPGS